MEICPFGLLAEVYVLPLTLLLLLLLLLLPAAPHQSLHAGDLSFWPAGGCVPPLTLLLLLLLLLLPAAPHLPLCAGYLLLWPAGGCVCAPPDSATAAIAAAACCPSPASPCWRSAPLVCWPTSTPATMFPCKPSGQTTCGIQVGTNLTACTCGIAGC